MPSEQLPSRIVATQDNCHTGNCRLSQLLPRITATQDLCHLGCPGGSYLGGNYPGWLQAGYRISVIKMRSINSTGHAVFKPRRIRKVTSRHGRPQKIFHRGGNVENLLMLFRLLTMQCKWTFTKRFTLSIPLGCAG